MPLVRRVAMISFAVLLWAGCLPLAAQTTTSNTGVSVQGTAYGGAGNGGAPAATIDSPPSSSGSNSFVGGDLNVGYSLAGRRLSLGASAGSAFQIYQLDDRVTVVGHAGSLGVSAAVTTRLTVSGTAGASYSPSYQFSLIPSGQAAFGQTAPPSLNFGLTDASIFTYSGGARVGYRTSSRSSLDLSYNVQYGVLSGLDLNSKMQAVGGSFRRWMTKTLGLRVGYYYQEAKYPSLLQTADDRFRWHNIDVGVDYARPVMLTRRSSLDFSVGSAVLQNTQGRFYNVLGGGILKVDLFRTWHVSGGYQRGLSFVSGFTAPVFADSALGEVRGGLGARMAFQGSVTYSQGSVGFGGGGRNLRSYRGLAQVTRLVSRRFAVFGDYFYDRNAFNGSVLLIPGATDGWTHHGVRGGLTFRVPPLAGNGPTAAGTPISGLTSR